jgi:hypothetical protein
MRDSVQQVRELAHKSRELIDKSRELETANEEITVLQSDARQAVFDAARNEEIHGVTG